MLLLSNVSVKGEVGSHSDIQHLWLSFLNSLLQPLVLRFCFPNKYKYTKKERLTVISLFRSWGEITFPFKRFVFLNAFLYLLGFRCFVIWSITFQSRSQRRCIISQIFKKRNFFSLSLSGLTENSGSAIVKVYAFRQNGQEFSSINFFSSELDSSSKEKHLQEIYFICSWWARISTWDVTILLPAFKILIISSFFYLFIELIGESGVFPWIFAVNISVVHEKGRKYVQ